MLVPRTLARSIAAEVSAFAAIGFFAFIVILLVQNLAQRLEELVAVGMTFRDTRAVMTCLVGMVAPYAAPVGFLFGILAAVGRLSADSEVTAMRACGLGLGAVFGPVLAIGVAIALLTALLMIRVEPAARRELRSVLADVASRGAILEPGRFRTIGGRVVYVQSRDRENRLERILIADRADPKRPFLIFAESGRFSFDAEQLRMRLELEQGDIHLESRDPGTHRRISFERFDYSIDATALFDRARNARPIEMDQQQLADHISGRVVDAALGFPPAQYEAAYHRRLAIPFAPFVFAALGVPLGLRRSRAARSWGVLVCVGLVAAYYTLLSFGQFVGESGRAPASLALWIPNLAFAIAAIPLLRRAQRGMA
jgi:lipopolysaccharide export system permease protein